MGRRLRHDRGRRAPASRGARALLAVVTAGLACHACASFDAAAPDASPDAAFVDAGAADAPLAPSCRALLARDPSLRGKNGIYAITPGDGGVALDVSCDMTLDEGGWTLAIVRAAAPSTARRASSCFGETSRTGV